MACRVQDEIILGAAFVFSGDDPPEVVTEALLPAHPEARAAVASCLTQALICLDGLVQFDGHVGGPHFYRSGAPCLVSDQARTILST